MTDERETHPKRTPKTSTQKPPSPPQKDSAAEFFKGLEALIAQQRAWGIF